MKLAIFDEQRLGVVVDQGIVDVTSVLPHHDPNPVTAGWWRALCRDFDDLSSRLLDSARLGELRPLSEVRLQAPILNPSKVIAAASNYAAHVQEMHGVQVRTLGQVETWMMDFDIFLKAPSSISGPAEDIVLPSTVRAAGHEIHHESELVIVIGQGGRDIAVEDAPSHIVGYTIGLDMTVRSSADRSRRKSYDTFSPLGPWLTTSDEVGDPGDLAIKLEVNRELRQDVRTADLLVPVSEILSYASSVMTLLPGDIIFTGAPPGVGPIVPGDTIDVQISRLGKMQLAVR